MIKSWWDDKTHWERSIVLMLALLSASVFIWYGIVTPVDNLIKKQQMQLQKMKRDLLWMEEQANTHGLLRQHPLSQPLDKTVLDEATRARLSIAIENSDGNSLSIKPATLPLENLSQWLNALQYTHSISIEELQFAIDTQTESNINVERLLLRSPDHAK